MENEDKNCAVLSASNSTDCSTGAPLSEFISSANSPACHQATQKISTTNSLLDSQIVNADSGHASATLHSNSTSVQFGTDMQLLTGEPETDVSASVNDDMDVPESGVDFISKGSLSSSPLPSTDMLNSNVPPAVFPASLPPFSHAQPALTTTYGLEPAAPSFLLQPQKPYIPTNPSPSTLSPAHIIHTPTEPSTILSAGHSVTSVPSVVAENTPLTTATTHSTVSSATELIQTSSSSFSAPTVAPSSADSQFAGTNGSGEYYVMVHVDAGEMFSVRVGDQIQHIPGPATVRMVSNSGPPLPMPMRVPPGHLVQQIVDEEGILTHVILSLYPGPGQPPPVQPNTAALNPGTHTNGLLNAGAGLVLDSTQHLRPSHSHLHHHPSVPSPASTVGGNPHMSLGVSAPVTPLQGFNPHQTLPPPPTGPPGAPPGHFHSQFMPHQHFHPYQFHPPHPSICSSGLKQQQHAVIANHAPMNGSVVRYSAVPDWPSNGLAEPDAMVSPATTAVTAESEERSQVEGDLGNHCAETEHVVPDQSTAMEISGVPKHVADDAFEETTKNGDEKSRSAEENQNPTSETSRVNSKRELHKNDNSKNCSPTTALPLSQQSSPSKASTLTSTQLQKPTTASTPLSEVNFNGLTSELSLHRQQPNFQSGGGFATSDPSGSSQAPSQLAAQRRRRTGAGKNNNSMRPTSRPVGANLSKASNNVTVTDSVMTTNNHVATTSSNSTKKPINAGSRTLNSVGATTNNNNNNNLTSGNTVSVQGDSDAFRVSSHSKPLNVNSSASSTYSHNGRGRGRTQQPYLLSTPPLHLQSNGLDYTHMPYSQPNDYAKGIPSPGGVSLQDRTHQTWESELEREAIQSVLSAIPAPQVSDVEAYSALIHLSLPSDLTVPLSFGENGELLNGGNLHVRPPSRSDVQTEANNKTDRLRTSEPESKTASDTSPNGETSWALDEAEIQFELHLAERDIDSRFNCVFIGEATYISLQDLRPGSDYYVKACCVYTDIRGQFSTIARFTTQPAEPTAPRNVTVVGHTRTSLHVKWSAAADNGSRITAYRLEYARANNAAPWSPQARDGLHNDSASVPTFIEGFYGLGKTCKLTQLTPSTEYLIRVMAENNYGSSPWSSITTASTSGSPPPTPRIPHLVTNGVHSLTLAWSSTSELSRPSNNPAHSSPNATNTNNVAGSSVSYMLEMDDEAMGHGFVTVFDGTGTEHCVENLRRNTRYRFRLAAINLDGRSRWSEVVTFSTLPDRPSAPRNLRLSGPLHATRLNLVWDTPEDDGGMPVQAYRLEMRLPYVPRADGTLNGSFDSGKFPNTTAIGYSDGIEKLLCWPHVTGLSGKTSFCSVPPAAVQPDGETQPVMPRLLVMNHESQRLTSLGLPHNYERPIHSTLFADELGEVGALLQCNTVGPDELSKLGYFTESDQCHIGWFTVYEGNGQEVLLDGLLPGMHFSVRVRARSAILDSDCTDCASNALWGSASAPPLQLSLPAVVPDAPATRPRLVGRPRPHSVCLAWQPPRTNGGAPILAYEVWQMNSNYSDSQSDESGTERDPICSTEAMTLKPAISSRYIRSRSSSPHSPESSTDANSKQSEMNMDTTEPGTFGRLVCSVPTTECRLSGLRPGHSYSFRVRARNRIGRSQWTSWASVTTVPSPPAAPTRAPRVYPQPESSQILVSWDPIQRGNGAPISGYLLEWKPIPNASLTTTKDLDQGLCEFQLLYSGLSLSYELNGVPPASRFAFRVCAVNSAGPGPWGPIGTCITPPTTPGQPCGLRVTNLETDTAQLHWFAPQSNGSPITSFTIELTRSQNDSTGSPVIQLFDLPSPSRPVITQSSTLSGHSNGGATEHVDYTLTELVPDCSYKFRVRALNAIGYGTFSSPLNFITLPPHPVAPEFTGFTHLTPTSVRVQWCLPQLPAPDRACSPNEDDNCQTTSMWQSNRSRHLRYTLQLSRDSDPEWVTVYEGSETMHKVTRLQENTTYSFRVFASNVSGQGAHSVIQSVTTLRLPPPSVRGLKATDVSADTCQLEWTPVSLTGSTDPVVYVLHLMPVQHAQSHSSTAPDTIPSQVYRGCQASCRVTDLLPNTEYVCRVCAIRLCQPAPSTVLVNGSQVDDSHLPDRWQREIVANPKFQIAELSGPFSHSLVFTTRAYRDAKSSPGKDVSALHLRGHSLNSNNKPNKDSSSHFYWLRSVFYSTFSWFGSESRSETGSTADEQQTMNSNVSGTIINGRASFTSSSHVTPNVTTLPSTSAWRRRIAPVSAATLQQSPKPGQTATPGIQQHHHHHHSGPKRGHSWFRLSERKLACLLLCLFALATLLVAVSLQHFLAASPNHSPSVTVE